MDDILMNVNWLAVIAGTVAAFALGMVWFGQLFGKVWREGSHNIARPESLPMPAMAAQLAGTFLLAWLIGATATINALGTAIVAILAIALLHLSAGLFSQKSTGAALVDAGYVVAMGVVMILAQGIL